MSGNAEQNIPSAKYLNPSFLGFLTEPRAPAAIACVKIEAIGVAKSLPIQTITNLVDGDLSCIMQLNIVDTKERILNGMRFDLIEST